MERVSERQEQASQLSRQLSSERVLAMMLGVQESQLTGRAGGLVGCQSWRKFFVKDQDETFVGQFLGAAVAILGSSIASNNLKIDKTGFSVHPKKVKMVSVANDESESIFIVGERLAELETGLLSEFSFFCQ